MENDPLPAGCSGVQSRCRCLQLLPFPTLFGSSGRRHHPFEMRASDDELLTRYGTEADQDAFAELVRRHLPAISAAARRMVIDPAAAEDVAQLVFTRLAQRWQRVPRRCVLGAWLHADTRLVALQFLRSERRRQLREQSAVCDPGNLQPEDTDWAGIRPLLDESLVRLTAADRDVIVMRFFEQCSLKDLADRLVLTEDATRMRINRALQRLGERLRQHGVATTAAALSTSLSAYAANPVPVSVAQTIAGLAITTSQSALPSLGASNLISCLLMNKTIPFVGAVLLVGLTVELIVQQAANSRLRAESARLEAMESTGVKP